MTVKGQVVDEGCSLKEMGQKGGDHEKAAEMDQCAIDCAKRGEPVALLTADGKVYRITGGLAANNNAKLVPHMGHTVEITGDVIREGRQGPDRRERPEDGEVTQGPGLLGARDSRPKAS